MPIVIIVLSLLVAPSVFAASPTRKDFADFQRSLFSAAIHSNPRMILQYCNEARDKAARFPAHKAWTALVMDCLGHAAYAHHDHHAACRYYDRAAAAFRKARPIRYESGLVSDTRKKTTAARDALRC